MPNPKQVLLPGQFTKVKLLLDVREGAIVVPHKAVTIEKGGAYIYTMRRDSTVEKRFIELGPEFGNKLVVERIGRRRRSGNRRISQTDAGNEGEGYFTSVTNREKGERMTPFLR